MANNTKSRFTTMSGAAAVGIIVLISVTGVVLATRGDRSAADLIASVEPASGSDVRGTVAFKKDDGRVRVTVDLTGLRPGAHGFNIHEKGDCSAPDATSAGDHFNPAEKPHGGPDSAQRHAGDLGNVVADGSGKARASRVDQHLTLDGPASIVGRAVVVHADPDDLASQPSGKAGARVGCGVIRRVEP